MMNFTLKMLSRCTMILTGLLFISNLAWSQCDDLFFTQYHEQGNNKCLEIYNPTSNTITLDNYQLRIFSNGNSSPNVIISWIPSSPGGNTIAAGASYVICNPSQALGITPNRSTGSINFNGNDAITLNNSSTVIDAIGEVGNSSVFGEDVHWIRKSSVTEGDSDETDAFSFAGSGEWDAGTLGSGAGFGSHTFDGCETEPPSICINEVDADTPGTDDMEFIELYDGGVGNTSLDGLVLVFFNGGDANNGSYRALDLDGFSTNGDGFFVAGNTGVASASLNFPNNGLQNGADAVALYMGDDTDFPSDTDPTTTNLVDAFVYDTNDGDDAALLAALGQSTQYNEGGSSTSNQRMPDCGLEVAATTPTPNSTNEVEMEPCAITNVFVSSQGACDGDDADFQVTFDVVGGSGMYEIVDDNLGTGYGQFLGGGPIGSYFINGTVDGPTTAEVLMVSVQEVGAGEGGCRGTFVSLNVPDCPIAAVCASVGDVIITEIMRNPSVIPDENGEYIEVYNAGNTSVDLLGWVLRDNDSDAHTIGSSVIIAPGGFALLMRNGDSGANGGLTADYVYGNDITLANGTDEVVLECSETVIDAVLYSNPAFPSPNGASMNLDAGSFDATANDDGSNWCVSTTPYETNNDGTPGGPNESCCAPPTAVCQSATINLNETNTVTPEDVDGGSEAECGVMMESVSPNMFTCNDLGSHTVTLTVTDNNGDASTCSASVTVEGLPCGFTQDDVNCDGGSSGSYNPATGTFELTSTNCYAPGFYRQTDSHAFIQSDLCGDGEIIAQVTGVAGNGWAGITMREGTGASERMIQLVIDGNSLTRRELRQSPGGVAYAHIFSTQGKNWLRLTRNGNTFGAYHSADGVNWGTILITNISMSSCIDIGMIVFNNSPSGTVTGTFENVAIFGGAPLSAPTQHFDIAVNNDQLQGVELFPNPATDEVNVKLHDFIGQEATISIFNVNGQVVQQLQLDEVYEGVQNINVNALDNGTYLMRVESAEHVVSKKFVIAGK